MSNGEANHTAHAGNTAHGLLELLAHAALVLAEVHTHHQLTGAHRLGVFIIFGAFLERTGIGDFFIQISNAVVGRFSGGPAKVAVVASALDFVSDRSCGEVAFKSRAE